jgi:hypothetical protein
MLFSQDDNNEEVYKKKVLESVEVDFLASYYTQSGQNAAVSGGIGDESLQNVTPNIVISIPLKDDDVISIDAGISAYTSASSSNVNPFDGNEEADPYQASSGASKADVLTHLKINYSHSADDRNSIWSANTSLSSEYDYFSVGGGGSFTKLFNDKNTEISIKGNVYIDNWKIIYPSELRSVSNFKKLDGSGRNSYSGGLGFSQILSKNIQGAVNFDVIYQKGLLSTPFQRVYFQDFENTYFENFQLADDIERMPSSRTKYAGGTFINFYVNQSFVIKTFYRYYQDNWDIKSHTASIELPIKISDYFTLYPYYRFYDQTAAKYFAPYEGHVSTEEFYTSDYDLSGFTANQYGFGVSYTDIFTEKKIWRFGLKSIDLKYNYYNRNSGLTASIITFGTKFVLN